MLFLCSLGPERIVS